MADEIQVSARLRVSNGNFLFNQSSGLKLFDQSAVGGGNPGTVNIGTSDEPISLGDISTPGWAYFLSMEAEGGNYVEIGPDSGGSIVPMLRLEPGEFALMRLAPGVSLRGQADTAAVDVLIQVMED